ncbi:MAG: hypothetical protein LBD52_03695 [Prevotellaceae bacterium]|jgi:hypothetical protein|nr:hypothetical protein [Prevotellaceae bacterium]
MSKKPVTAKKTKPAAKTVKKITKPVKIKKLPANPAKKAVPKKTAKPVKKAPVKAKKTTAKKTVPSKVAVVKKPVKKVAPVKKTKKSAKPVAKTVKSKQIKEPIKAVKTGTKQVQKTVKDVSGQVRKPEGKKAVAVAKQEKTPIVAPVKKIPVQSGGKRRLVVSYKNLTQDVLDAIKEKYPHGYNDYMADIMKVDKPDGTYFYAITIDLPNVTYLVKIDVKIDTDYEEVEKEIFGGGPENTGSDNDDFPDTGDDNSDFSDEAEEDEE